jgi:hypothetical protein
MNVTVEASIALQLIEIAAGGRVADVPEAPLYWGSDLSCVTDCDATFSELKPGTPLIIAQYGARRLITPRGAVLDDPDFGFDLRSYCNRGVTTQDLRTLQTRCSAELLKDERLLAASVEITLQQPSGLSVKAQLTPADPALSPFAFVFAVSDVSTLLELI